MSEYGSGISLKQAFKMDRERIRHALKGELVCGETEDGFSYAPCTKEEAEEYILQTFDNAVYLCMHANAGAKVFERILKEDAGFPVGDIVQLYLRYMEEETADISNPSDDGLLNVSEKPDTLKEFANRLDGLEYDELANRVPEVEALFEEAKARGIIIIYGLSDDLMEFDGALCDEAGCWCGKKDSVMVTFDAEGTSDDGKTHRNRILAYWCRNSHTGIDYYSWTYETDIPHEEFDIFEEGEKWCRGIVFFAKDMR